MPVSDSYLCRCKFFPLPLALELFPLKLSRCRFHLCPHSCVPTEDSVSQLSFVFGSLGLRARFCFAGLRCSRPVRPRAEGAVRKLLQPRSLFRRSRLARRPDFAFPAVIFRSCLRFHCSPPPPVFLLACACSSVTAPPRVAAPRFRFFFLRAVLEPSVLRLSQCFYDGFLVTLKRCLIKCF